MSSQFRFTKLISFTFEKGETNEQVLSSYFPSEQEQIPTFRTLITLFHIRHTPLLYKDASISEQRAPSAQRNVYTFRARPIYLSFETYIPFIRDLYTFCKTLWRNRFANTE